MKSKVTAVLVSGANGYLASNLMPALISKGCKILAVSHNVESVKATLEGLNVSIARYDFQQPGSLKKAFAKCDAFVNFAWRAPRGSERNNREFQFENAEASVRLASEAIETGAKRIIQIGSLAEYGKYTGRLSEHIESAPITEYGKAKLYCAEKMKILCEKKGVEFVELRMGSIYGGVKDSSILKRIGEAVEKGERFPMETACNQNWEFIHVNDVVNVIVKSIFEENIPMGVYNVSNGETKPLKEFLSEYAESVGGKSSISYGNQENGLGCYEISTNVAKLMAVFNIDTLIKFTDGIKL